MSISGSCAHVALSFDGMDGEVLAWYTALTLTTRIIATLVEYFYFGRPYKVILKRLELVHGIKRRYGFSFDIIIKFYFGLLVLLYPR